MAWVTTRHQPDLEDVEAHITIDTKVSRELGLCFPAEMVQGHKMSLEISLVRAPRYKFPEWVRFHLRLVHSNTEDEVRTHDNAQLALFRERRIKGESNSLCLEEIVQPDLPHLLKCAFDSMKLRVTSGGKKNREVLFQFLLNVTFSPSVTPCLSIRSPPFSVRAKNNDGKQPPTTSTVNPRRKRKTNSQMEDGSMDESEEGNTTKYELTFEGDVQEELRLLQARLAAALSLNEQLKSENEQLLSSQKQTTQKALAYRAKAKASTKRLYCLYGDLNFTSALQGLMSDKQNQRFVAEESDPSNLSDDDEIITTTTTSTASSSSSLHNNKSLFSAANSLYNTPSFPASTPFDDSMMDTMMSSPTLPTSSVSCVAADSAFTQPCTVDQMFEDICPATCEYDVHGGLCQSTALHPASPCSFADFLGSTGNTPGAYEGLFTAPRAVKLEAE